MDRNWFSFVVRIKITPVHRKVVNWRKQTVFSISSQVFSFRGNKKAWTKPRYSFIWPIRGCAAVQPGYWFWPFCLKQGIECFHMTSRRPYWCPKTMKQWLCWCPKSVLWELNSFLTQMDFFCSNKFAERLATWVKRSISVSLHDWSTDSLVRRILFVL